MSLSLPGDRRGLWLTDELAEVVERAPSGRTMTTHWKPHGTGETRSEPATSRKRGTGTEPQPKSHPDSTPCTL